MATPAERVGIAAGVNARSWLFAPGDSERKMEKAAAGTADIVILDLEDSVAAGEKPKARSMVSAFLRAHASLRERLWVRINPIQGSHSLCDLAAVMASGPGGIMLPKPRGRADAELLHHYLTALEASAGIALGSTRVIPLVGESAEGLLAAASYAGVPRLAAMSWGAEDLATELGAVTNQDESGSYDFTYQLARSLCLVGAAAAGVPAIETIHADFKDQAGLAKRAAAVRRAGYRGMLAIHPAQVDVINEVFTPSTDEIASAREIVDLFAANPGAGAIGHKGAMLDRPHLVRAQAVLALAARR
jgi:citrate lyase subunit beta/citryl-CoA lyase